MAGAIATNSGSGWSHYFYTNWCNQQDTLTVSGVFLPAGSTTGTTTALAILKANSIAGAPAGYTGQRGYNFQVFHDATNTGQYDVTLDRDVPDILEVNWNLSISAIPGGSPIVIQTPGTNIIGFANANIRAGTNQQFHFSCTYYVTTTATDLANNVLNTIGFTAILKISAAYP
jgi:hypothetical protein